jgi:signal peptidase I
MGTLLRRPVRRPFLLLAVGSCLSYLVFSRFAVGTAVVCGESMTPTLRPGQLCIIHKWPYLLGQPRRGDLVVYRHPDTEGLTVKRVIGVPGDEIRFRHPFVLVNGQRLVEGYLPEEETTTRGAMAGESVEVPAGQYFVLGDNRNASDDSRWTGTIRREWIVGRINGPDETSS